jgi:hypothetical protein
MSAYKTQLSDTEKMLVDGFQAALNGVPSGPMNSTIQHLIRQAMRAQYHRVAEEFDARAQDCRPAGAETSGRD